MRTLPGVLQSFEIIPPPLIPDFGSPGHLFNPAGDFRSSPQTAIIGRRLETLCQLVALLGIQQGIGTRWTSRFSTVFETVDPILVIALHDLVGIVIVKTHGLGGIDEGVLLSHQPKQMKSAGLDWVCTLEVMRFQFSGGEVGVERKFSRHGYSLSFLGLPSVDLVSD